MRLLGAKLERLSPGLSHDARDLLLAHSWPGNIREVHNAIERALILAESELISAQHLGIVPRPPRGVADPAGAVPEAAVPATMPTIAEQEKRMIAEALRRTKGNKARAAAALGLSPTQLFRRIRRFGLNVQSEPSIPEPGRAERQPTVRNRSSSPPNHRSDREAGEPGPQRRPA